jgi:trimethylamine:corrinoid methyltransferase-like protein
MLTQSQKELLRDKVLDLLWAVGMRVDHEQIEADLLKLGCEKSASGRVRMPRRLVEEFTASQLRSRAQDEDEDQWLSRFGIIDWGNFLLWTNRRAEEEEKMRSMVRTSIFDCGPTKYYDYPIGKVLPVDTEIFVTMKKWAHTVPEIGYTSTWYRQDVPAPTERIESLVLGLKTTDKLGGIEAMDPAHIKYLQAIGEIVTGRPNENAYICGSQCVTPPLIFEHRSAEETAERARRNVKRYHVASMMSIGMNTPVTPAAAMILMAAEILGGMICVFSQDPDADITGRMLASIVDMRHAQVSYATPECAIVNVGVKELFQAHFGGHIRVDDFFTTVARRPGLQAVAECYAGAARLARLLGRSDMPYPGVGSLDNGGVGSATQAVLDIEIKKSEFMRGAIAVDDTAIPWPEIVGRVEAQKDFMTSDHTLDHFRELWGSPLFRTDDPAVGGWAGDEKAILDKCDEMWRESLKTYTPPQWPDDTLKALDHVVADAHKELLEA